MYKDIQVMHQGNELNQLDKLDMYNKILVMYKNFQLQLQVIRLHVILL